jgi:hypothetical protein
MRVAGAGETGPMSAGRVRASYKPSKANRSDGAGSRRRAHLMFLRATHSARQGFWRPTLAKRFSRLAVQDSS